MGDATLITKAVANIPAQPTAPTTTQKSNVVVEHSNLDITSQLNSLADECTVINSKIRSNRDSDSRKLSISHATQLQALLATVTDIQKDAQKVQQQVASSRGLVQTGDNDSQHLFDEIRQVIESSRSVMADLHAQVRAKDAEIERIRSEMKLNQSSFPSMTIEVAP
eukprot:c11604_g1_i1.p1 GENE.c11604_g1_i1~~c11604_g1_i1.p1  ORF type:complete len:166 (-),score=56.75 c11604_g1_i1:46-543(-)